MASLAGIRTRRIGPDESHSVGHVDVSALPSGIAATVELVRRRRHCPVDSIPMCGIAAIFSFESAAPPSLERGMRTVCSRMSCRGPDGSGVWRGDGGRVILGHRRLSIIDLSENGAQPMVEQQRDLAIVFNGEIYNFRELKDALKRKGHTFRSESDTEVLLRLYEEFGPDMVHHIRGMFAFALWDGKKHGLLLARDHFGIKPLYIAQTPTGIMAASEVKALLELEDIDKAHAAGHVGFFLWGHVPEPFTLYRGIRSLPAGSTVWIDSRGMRNPTRYASVGELFEVEDADLGMSRRNICEELRGALLESVRYHLVADVDVGVFLSSGLDSATLTALASELQGRLRTVTLGFEEYRGTTNDETPLAEAIARQYGTSHTTVWVRREDFAREFDRLVDRMDQPTIDGINTYFVAKAAAESGLKVAISGLGGDELFGGYPAFGRIPRLVSLVGKIPSANAVGRTASGSKANAWSAHVAQVCRSNRVRR